MTFSQETAEALKKRMKWDMIGFAVTSWPRRKRSHGRRGARGFGPELTRRYRVAARFLRETDVTACHHNSSTEEG